MSQPIRSPRYVYLLTTITQNVDTYKEALDSPPGSGGAGGTRPLYVKMKKSIGDWLGLTPLAYNDPAWTGTFVADQTGALNTGSNFRRRLGGFRVASYTLIAEENFAITELIRQPNGSYTSNSRNFKTISIGFPKGHTVTEFIAWLATTSNFSQVIAVRTPAGTTHAISIPS